MATYYIQTNVLCMLILLIVNLAIRNKKGALPARRIAFTNLILIAAVMCVTDIIAWWATGRTFNGAWWVVQLSNIIYDATITWIGYAWLKYVELRIRSLEYNQKKRSFVMIIPLIVMLVLLFTNPFTGFLFTVDDANQYSRAGGIIVHWIISWSYLLFATVEVLLEIRKAKSKVEKRQLTPMLWFIVPPVAAALVQMLFYGVTSTQCGITLAILIIAINYLNDEVSKDTLTGLNNRRALESYVIERLQKTNSKLTILMCDVDEFKSINDTLGHTAGDLVLKRMASAMKSVCGESDKPLFLCRYGGDEFVICGLDLNGRDIQEIIKLIETRVHNMNADYADKFNFGISIGYATGVCTTYQDVEALISMSDAMMYETKQSKKLNSMR